MLELAEDRRRFGSPRLHELLRRDGLVQNHKRTERIYQEENARLKRLVGEQALDIVVLKDVISKNF